MESAAQTIVGDGADSSALPDNRLMAKRRRARVPRLYGVAEVGAALDVKVQNLQFIRDLPQPVAHVRATRLWLADEIEQFAEVYKQRRAARGHRSQAA